MAPVLRSPFKRNAICFFILFALSEISIAESPLASDKQEAPYRLESQTHYRLPYGILSTFVSKKKEKQAHSLTFQSWDFNRDGVADMVEVFGEDGRVQQVLYDLDFDGFVDEKIQSL